jgi:hypothetical protein
LDRAPALQADRLSGLLTYGDGRQRSTPIRRIATAQPDPSSYAGVLGAMGKLRSALAFGLLVMLLACGEQRIDRGPNATLAAAVERTIGAESFRVRLTVTDGREQRVSQVEYAAPDRVRISLRPRGETVWIGGDTYYATPEEPNRFVLVETACENTLEVAIPALSVLRDVTDVRRNGPNLVFRSDDGAGMTGRARIVDGFLASLLLRYELPDVDRKVIERYSFSRFGDTISIARPDESSITAAQGVDSNQGSPVPCPEAPSTEIEEG